jgi:L-aspartate oxidase
VQAPDIIGSNYEDRAGARWNVLGNTLQNGAFDNILVRVLPRSHFECRHVIPLYHGVITLPVQRLHTDFVVVGAGVAGLRAAIELAGHGRVLVIAKDSLRESSSEYAQGGIAVALSDDDEIGLHEQDTLVAGDGLCNLEAVHTLVAEGPTAIEQLIEWGTGFDREGAELLFTREGAHSRHRILHAHGDSTGHEIVRALRVRAAQEPNLSFQSFAAVTELLQRDGEVAGVCALDERTNTTVNIECRGVLLATGGLGRVFENTTNPDVATGDGVACAWRAGAEISDMEFVQFHPTALYIPSAPRFLLSEALRGEGGYLRNSAGQRFMEQFHPLEELAPRDVVSRAITVEMRKRGDQNVFLDLTHLPSGFVKKRFPRIYETCLRYGVDLETTLAPVRPAAHYAMGGVRTDLFGRTTVRRLYAAGETACNGVHGANRLASNSLLEAVVFGARSGAAMSELGAPPQTPVHTEQGPLFPTIVETEVRSLAWRDCGVVRGGPELSAMCSWLHDKQLEHRPLPTRADFELRNMHEVAYLIATAALAREESRGGHYRADFPNKSPHFAKHSILKKLPGSGLDAQISFS